MCTRNHPTLANPGYLFESRLSSIAAQGALYTRILAHHEEMGLSCEQIKALLDLNYQYHAQQVGLQLEFMKISEQLEIKRGQVYDEDLEWREPLLRRHAELFYEHEKLFFEHARRGTDILSDEQVRIGDSTYHTEKDEMLSYLAPSIQNATGFVLSSSDVFMSTTAIN
jgi:DNA-binding transcriptional MerR regulator